MKKLFFLLILLSPILAIAQACATWVNVGTTNVSCNGDSTGIISATAIATAMPITYSLGGVITSSNTTGTFNGLPVGLYTVTAADANNCSVSSVVAISEPSALAFASVNITSPSCIPNSNGTVCVTGSGGTLPYQYVLSGPGPITSTTNGCFVNLQAGNYFATVVDANNCTAQTAVTIAAASAPVINSVTGFNTNPCDPDTIHVLATPGSSTQLSYMTNPPGLLISPGTIILPGGGTYTISVTDANNCTASTIYTSNSNGPQLVSSQVTQPPCGTTNGSITVNANWPNTAFTYVLNPGNISNTTGVFNNLGIGNYTVSVQGPNCSMNLGSYTLSSTLNPYPITTTQNTFTATAPTNGTPPYVYTLNGQVITGPQSGLRCTGIDTFKITDAGGCTFDTIFNFVSGNTFPSITLNKNITDASCGLTNDGQIVYAPSAALSYNWLANLSVLGSTASSHTNLTPDTYVVQLTSANGDCIHDTSVVGVIGTNCGNIIGKAFYDTLVNCNYDSGEIPLANVTVTVMPGNLQTLTNANGDFQFLGLPFGNYTVEVDTNLLLHHYPSCNLLQYDTLSSSNTVDTNYFPHENLAPIDLYAITYVVPKAPASPALSMGRTQPIYYGYLGAPATPVDVNLYALMDSIHHYDTSSVPPTIINGDTLMWSLNNINANNLIFLYYDSMQNLPINHLMPFKVWIEPTSAIVGNNTANDTSCVNLPIVTSFDPNDKQVSPQGIGPPGYIDQSQKELSYLIRFQNTGNAMAYNIFIEDTISNRLDINSLQVLSASHPYLIEKDNNLIRFRFNNVMLPDSNADEPNSHGYIQYSIQQDAGNQKGDVINNTAHIYFDFNPAVVTNTTINTIGLPVSVENVTRSSRFAIYPNPSKNLVYIQELENEPLTQISLRDIMGRIIPIDADKRSANESVISLSHLSPGVYLLQINGESFKLIKE